LSGSSVLCWLQQKAVGGRKGQKKRRGKRGEEWDRTGRDETEWRGKTGGPRSLGANEGWKSSAGGWGISRKKRKQPNEKRGKEEEKRRRKNEGYQEKMREKPKSPEAGKTLQCWCAPQFFYCARMGGGKEGK
jgi:hypothetical protein